MLLLTENLPLHCGLKSNIALSLYLLKKFVKLGPMYCVNIDFNIDFSQVYFELHIDLCYVLGLKKMSVNLENILSENCQYLFVFLLFFYVVNIAYCIMTDVNGI